MGSLDVQPPDPTRFIHEIHQQEGWRRAFGALILFGAAAMAYFVNPTTAIAFASLAIAAVYLIPPLRKKILGDLIALKDSSGTYRVAIDGGTGAGPSIMLFDSDGRTVRAVLSLQADGSPALSFFDEEGRGRFVASYIGPGMMPVGTEGAPVIHLFDKTRVIQAELRVGPDGGALRLGEEPDGMCVLGNGLVAATKGENRAALRATKDEAYLICQFDGSNATFPT